MNIVCFHNLTDENEYLSNWYASEFMIEGKTFSSMEQFMMHQKALLFNDQQVAKQIMETNDPSIIKALGRQVAGYNEIDWNGIRQIVVYEGLIAKFSQNESLKNKLLTTKDALLVECSISDKIWGNGLSITDPDRLSKEKWKGQNLLGYTLMKVRDKLKV